MTCMNTESQVTRNGKPVKQGLSQVTAARLPSESQNDTSECQNDMVCGVGPQEGRGELGPHLPRDALIACAV
jgi:hypothetical protein